MSRCADRGQRWPRRLGHRRAGEERRPGIGFDALNEEFTDMVKAGIVDPAKVTRTALQNAGSIAGMLLTTEAVISEIPKKEKAPAMPSGDMDF